MQLKLLLISCIASALVIACSETVSLEGRWVEPIPGMENKIQGIELAKGGQASSINMATLQYEKWDQQGNKLILSGKSIGNGQSGDFTDILTIEKVTDNELVLKKGNLNITYHRQQ
ncbi:lipocalin-like domain-containing protein [Succinatimonas hippei]|uniref:Lipocalin-like domain-containing protein n=1 Tax=Succinatimonas hippei (strain DSM 22608 / JCM 16073 / KCTC 15190 / YIT 12066) TaxID=762983 RepID=E8LKS4_SUCHY|nr:lipocalin family protein [Succinatimonas hippei]EFY06877.1 hypothetical protein HMPREF9444_01322 [Succinatimonas hippei YIT 12066]